MLQWAARGVAMGNAPDEVKAIADEVTGSVDEAGLALTLRPDSGAARTAPGVAAIPFDRIGLYADEDRPVVPPRAKDLQRDPGTPEHGFDSTVDVEASNRKNP